jgi:hypothetical protein
MYLCQHTYAQTNMFTASISSSQTEKALLMVSETPFDRDNYEQEDTVKVKCGEIASKCKKQFSKTVCACLLMIFIFAD